MRQEISNAAQTVFDELGAGWSESVYHRAVEREFAERGIPFSSEGTLSVMYKGAPVGRRRPDLFVVTDNGTIIVELKAGSSSGTAQLEQYLEMGEASDDLGYIRGGAVIRFNKDVEYEFIELGPKPNPDDRNVD